MRRRDYAGSLFPLFFPNLFVQRMHLGPVELGPEMMLGMVPIIEPSQVVQLVIGADSPGYRFVRVPSVVKKISVQIR